MYKLTLTHSERQAIDWVGDRYAHGYYLYKLLWGQCQYDPPDADWDTVVPITFDIPEHVAWEISSIIEADNLACFCDALKMKLFDFDNQIV